MARFEPPTPAGRWQWPRKPNREEAMSQYLDQPLFPLAVALPRLLVRIERDLPTARPEEKHRLEMRAGQMRELLASRPVT